MKDNADPSLWSIHEQAIINCKKCPRLREHCLQIAQTKRKAFIDENYWGKPVPAFGDKSAQLIIMGLAPAAHGANRTGRMFTGDRSGLWLYRALYKAGFSNQAESTSAHDNLKIKNAFITATVRCAPPDNKPTKEESENCFPYLEWEFESFKNAKIFLALGKIAFDQTWKLLKNKNPDQKLKPRFSHGACYELSNNQFLLGSYHPSQQNTFTGKLTESMFDSVFEKAKRLL